jgi:hypothetical protein
MRRLYICYLLIAVCFSCNKASPAKDYGIISSELFEIPAIDTTNHVVQPIDYETRSYSISNKSTDHKINFICKAYLKGHFYCEVSLSGNKSILEHTEKHTVAPKETIKLDIDSNRNYEVLKYEIVSASTIK